MKKFLIVCLLLLLGASQSFALEATGRVIGARYTRASFVFDYASADTGMWKTVLFTGKTIATVARIDSITGTHTDPDTIAKSNGTFENGTTYYWYAELTDSSASTHTTIRWPAAGYATFTTADFQQNLTITEDYSSAQIIHDSVGYYVAPLDSLVLQYGTVSGTYTVADTITSVTHPDTFALTGLMEGGTYYCRTKAYIADSSITDTSAEFSFTMTNLQSTITVLRSNADSLILVVDSVDMNPDTIYLHHTTSAMGLSIDSVVIDTNDSPSCPDTFTITGIIEGEDVYYKVIFVLADSAWDTSTVTSYSRPHNTFMQRIKTPASGFDWPENATYKYLWEFTGAGSDYSTGPLPIKTPWIRVHASIDGADDTSPGDSIAGYIWSWDFNDSTVIDTIMAMDADTGTITPLSYRMYPSILTDSTLTYYPTFNWGTHFSISVNCIDTTIFEDSTIGKRSVGLIIEEIP